MAIEFSIIFSEFFLGESELENLQTKFFEIL